jgi:hypothetical protein
MCTLIGCLGPQKMLTACKNGVRHGYVHSHGVHYSYMKKFAQILNFNYNVELKNRIPKWKYYERKSIAHIPFLFAKQHGAQSFIFIGTL